MNLKTFLLSLLLTSASFATNAEVYTRQCDDKAKVELATSWMESGAWRNGFEKADPHETVNPGDCYEQYSKN